MARRLTQALAVLLAVCVANAASTPSLGDLLRQTAGSGRVSTASVQDDPYGYDQYGIETKELCLQETEMKACGWANNCADDGNAANGPPVCVTGQYWTSDFACCQEQHYGYDGPTGLRHSQLWSHAANIGTCDWTVSYVDLRNLDYTTVTAGSEGPPLVPATAVATSGSTDITSNIAKLGSAWATCYLGADSETCGGPLCDRMVMSMQGTVYRATQAYSHWSATSTATNAMCVTVNGPIDTANAGNTPPGRAADAAASVPPHVFHEARAPMQVGPASTSAQLQNSYGHSGYYDGDNTNRAVFRGPATIIMGIINGMAGQHKEKWDEGVFEYVPYFLPDVAVSAVAATDTTPAIAAVPAGNPMATPVSIDASYPWVRDKTYKITFYRGAKY